MIDGTVTKSRVGGVGRGKALKWLITSEPRFVQNVLFTPNLTNIFLRVAMADLAVATPHAKYTMRDTRLIEWNTYSKKGRHCQWCNIPVAMDHADTF